MSGTIDFNSATTDELNTYIEQGKSIYDNSTSTPKSFGASGSAGDSYKTRMSSLIAVLQKRVNDNPATTLAEIDANYVQTEKEIEVAKTELESAKARAETLRKPDEQSYYESWFPINRPLKRSSIFIILIIGIFLIMLSFMIAIRSFGINVNVSFAPPPQILLQLSKLFPWQSLVLIGILLTIAVLALLRKI